MSEQREQYSTVSCPECGSYEVQLTTQDCLSGLCEYRCSDCSHYFLSEVLEPENDRLIILKLIDEAERTYLALLDDGEDHKPLGRAIKRAKTLSILKDEP
jgi:transposase-like protein